MLFAAFIFDMDGTLLDNMGFHFKIWTEFLGSLGVTIDEPTFARRTVGRVNAEILRELVSPDLTDEEVKAYSLIKERLYREAFTPHMKAVPGLELFLERARRDHIQLALGTTANQDNVAYVLEGLAIARYFPVVVCSEDIRHGKPDPEIFLTAASRLGADPAACLVFEDAPYGLEAAHRAGMQAVALTTTFPPERLAHLPGVRRVVADYTGLDPASL